MIYLFHGTDVGRVRRKAFEWIAKAREKEPNLAYIRLAREEINESTLLDAATANSLFAKRTLTLLDDPNVGRQTSHIGEENGKEDELTAPPTTLDDYTDMLADSDNAIIILAPRLTAALAKKLIAKAKIEYKFDLMAEPEFKRGFNSNLVNALAAKNREKLWLEIVRAVRAGDAPEMLHGLLHWKARDLMENGGVKWPPASARALSLALIALLQDSRRKGLDLSESLERFALSVYEPDQ